MNIVKKLQMGEVTAWQMGYAPVGRPVMSVYFFHLGDALIDSGQPNMRHHVLEAVKPLDFNKIILTHHHEDHSGNAAAINRQSKVAILGHAIAAHKMNHISPILPYQRIVWGQSETADVTPYKRTINIGPYSLLPIHTPGHSKDHTVYLEPDNGLLFSGDLYLGDKIKFFRSDEDIAEQIDSLKKVLTYDFDALFCAHNPCDSGGKTKLKNKLNYLEDIVGRVRQLTEKGLSPKSVIKKMGQGHDRFVKIFTMGNASFSNMIRSALNAG